MQVIDLLIDMWYIAFPRDTEAHNVNTASLLEPDRTNYASTYVFFLLCPESCMATASEHSSFTVMLSAKSTSTPAPEIVDCNNYGFQLGSHCVIIVDFLADWKV
jgi:hypothetical protein